MIVQRGGERVDEGLYGRAEGTVRGGLVEGTGPVEELTGQWLLGPLLGVVQGGLFRFLPSGRRESARVPRGKRGRVRGTCSAVHARDVLFPTCVGSRGVRCWILLPPGTCVRVRYRRVALLGVLLPPESRARIRGSLLLGLRAQGWLGEPKAGGLGWGFVGVHVPCEEERRGKQMGVSAIGSRTWCMLAYGAVTRQRVWAGPGWGDGVGCWAHRLVLGNDGFEGVRGGQWRHYWGFKWVSAGVGGSG